MTIHVRNREEPSSRDPFVMSLRHARRGVLESIAKRAFLRYDAYGEVGAGGSSAKAATPDERGRLARFLVEARQNHLMPYLGVSCDADEEWAFLGGRGLRDHDLLSATD